MSISFTFLRIGELRHVNHSWFYLILLSAAPLILDSQFSKNGAPTRISEPMAEQWIDPTAREIKVGGKWSTCVKQQPQHCLSCSNPRTNRKRFLFSQHSFGQTPLNNGPDCANGRVQCRLKITWNSPKIPADRTDAPNRTIEFEFVDRIWSTRECVEHVDAQIAACWNRLPLAAARNWCSWCFCGPLLRCFFLLHGHRAFRMA